MNVVVLGNILCTCGAVIMTLLGFIKKKRNFLLAQCGMNCFYMAGLYLLGGISGMLTNLMTMLRNIVCMRWNLNVWLKIAFIAAQIGIVAAFGCRGVIAWMPVIGNCVFTWYMDTENMILLKAIIIGTQILWGIYDFSLMNYATMCFDIAAIVTNSIGICSILKARKENQAET